MKEFRTLRITPPIKTMEDALTNEECDFLISNAKDNLSPGRVIADSGDTELYISHRNCTTASLSSENSANIAIQEKISKIIGIDKSRFEGITVIRYLPGEDFKRHPDYIAGPGGATHIEKGGNRHSTVIMYLNDVEEGGDTDFPWLRLWVTPKKGSILYFDYSDPDPFIKRSAEHCGKPIIKGEKWIATIWVREFDRTTLFPDHSQYVDINSIIYPEFRDTAFELEVGPDNDRKIMSVSLPVNHSPENTILVGFTGGMDSSLLLYILGALNSQQVIPYFIKPLVITSGDGSSTGRGIGENFENTIKMVKLIEKKVNGNILQPKFYPGPPHLSPYEQIGPGLINYFFTHDEINKYSNNVLLFTGNNEVPGKGSGLEGGPVRPQNVPEYMCLPFKDLKKYHILDAIFQLGLEDILENTAKCGTDHKSLNEPCSNWHCMERRWAYSKINKDEFGLKYH